MRAPIQRVQEHRAVGADGKHVGEHGAILLHQCRGRGIVRRIDDMMRLGIAAQEILQLQDVRRLRLSDQHRPGRARLDERNASENEGADDALAEVSSAIISARSWSCGTSSASTSSSASPSTSAERPESCATSPRNCPRPCRTIGTT